MKNFLSIFALLASVLSAFAEVNVDIDEDGLLHVWGCVEIDDYYNVFSNSLGNCTNCIQISPEQMLAYKTSILSDCDSADTNLVGIIKAALLIYERMNLIQQDILTFQRFGNSPEQPISATSSDYISFTNYVYTSDNTQTTLDLSHSSLPGSTIATRNNAAARWVGYNNGIYDYANTHVLPAVTSSKSDAEEIVIQADSARIHIDTIRTTVSGMSEEACQGCSGGGDGGDGGDGGGSCGDCPCAEQMDAINDYVKHIDDDFHVQLQNMAYVTNFIPRMDSYAQLVSGILYNDATIIVDDGENSWSNVYRRGYSDLYDYDKSNILQRIELLVFGLTSFSSPTNWGDIGDLSGDSVEVPVKFADAATQVHTSHDDLKSNIETIHGKIEGLFGALNFFGAGSLSEFSLNDPYTLDDFGGYTFEVTSDNVESLAPLRNIVRTCFQVFYWVSGIVFMIFFWYWTITFVVGHVLRVLRFFNNLLT